MTDSLSRAAAAELRTIAMPADTNASGDIFGGWLLSQMDLAGGSYVSQLVNGRVATVGIEAMSFHRPVYVGDQVSCFCSTIKVGRTSVSVHVETWARRRNQQADGQVKVTEGIFTFVALDETGNKRTVPDTVRLTIEQ